MYTYRTYIIYSISLKLILINVMIYYAYFRRSFTFKYCTKTKVKRILLGAYYLDAYAFVTILIQWKRCVLFRTQYANKSHRKTDKTKVYARRYLCFKNKQRAQNQLMVHIKKRLRDTFVRFSIGRLYERFIRGDKSSESSKSTVAKSTKLGGSLKGTTASASACTYLLLSFEITEFLV